MTVDGNFERYDLLFIELEKARLEMLKADAAVTLAKREFHESGVVLSAAALNALYVEQERAGIKVQELKIQAMQAKQEAKRLKTGDFMSRLIDKVEAAGFANLVAEARAESLQALADAGLRSAYTS
jgi:hypothetical protein